MNVAGSDQNMMNGVTALGRLLLIAYGGVVQGSLLSLEIDVSTSDVFKTLWDASRNE